MKKILAILLLSVVSLSSFCGIRITIDCNVREGSRSGSGFGELTLYGRYSDGMELNLTYTCDGEWLYLRGMGQIMPYVSMEFEELKISNITAFYSPDVYIYINGKEATVDDFIAIAGREGGAYTLPGDIHNVEFGGIYDIRIVYNAGPLGIVEPVAVE